jgi:hypothetical protein
LNSFAELSLFFLLKEPLTGFGMLVWSSVAEATATNTSTPIQPSKSTTPTKAGSLKLTTPKLNQSHGIHGAPKSEQDNFCRSEALA